MSRKDKFRKHYRYGRFVQAFYEIWQSDARRDLTTKARCLIVELQLLEFPKKNGQIGLSEVKAAELLGCSPNTASKAFQELIDHGFIERCYDGDYTKGKASEWRITFLRCGNREATNDWKYWKRD